MTRPVTADEALYVGQVLDNLPAAVHAHRSCRGESLRVAAIRIGCDYTGLQHFETGRVDPKLSMIRKMLAYLEEPCSPSPTS